MSPPTYRELLKNNRNFRSLWTGQMISELGTWFSFIAELGLVRSMSGSALTTTALLVARLLPFLLVAPMAGVFADRRSRRQIMIVSDLLRAVIALMFVAAGWMGSAWLVILCSALNASLSMFFESAKNASIPNLVTPRELLSANVLMFSTRFLQYTLGSAIGGLTAAQFGYDTAFVVNALSFAVSAVFIALIPENAMRRPSASPAPASEAAVSQAQSDQAVIILLPADPMSVETQGGLPIAGTELPLDPEQGRFWSDVREGLRFIWANPFVRGVILVNVGWATGGGMTAILFDQIGGHEFAAGGPGDWYVAALFSAGGVGVFFGMLLARRIGQWTVEQRRAGLYIGWSLLAHGVLFAIGGLMPTLTTMAIFIALSRVVLGAEFGVQETMMMRVLPDDYRGRVFTTDRSLEWSTMALATIVTGWLLTWFSPRALMVASGLLSASPGLIWLLALWLSRFKVPAGAVRESYGD
jgi:MFS family permease